MKTYIFQQKLMLYFEGVHFDAGGYPNVTGSYCISPKFLEDKDFPLDRISKHLVSFKNGYKMIKRESKIAVRKVENKLVFEGYVVPTSTTQYLILW